MRISGETSVPLSWVIAMVVFTIGAAGGLVKLGQYVGGKDAGAAEVEKRVSILERRVDAQAGVESRIDRRLYRLELAQHIETPKSDRLPVGNP